MSNGQPLSHLRSTGRPGSPARRPWAGLLTELQPAGQTLLRRPGRQVSQHPSSAGKVGAVGQLALLVATKLFPRLRGRPLQPCPALGPPVHQVC